MSDARYLLPWSWTVLIGITGVVLLVSGASAAQRAEHGPFTVIAVGAVILITALGSVITSRQPGNKIAWLLHAISIGLLISIWSSSVAETGVPTSPGFREYLAAVLLNGLSGAVLYAVFLLLYLFPTGHFLTPRWRWAGWLCLVVLPVMLLAALLSEEVGPTFADDPWSMPNPIGVLPPEVLGTMGTIWLLAVLALAVGGAVSMIVRYRRSDPVVRTQIKWVLYAAVISAASLPIGFADFGALSSAGMMIAFGLIPVAVAVAVTRYKLFEIDRLVSRTISYAMVVALLGVVFAAGVVWIPTALDLGDSSLLVAASTLAVAALFNPLRKRVQHAVDRRFNRSAYQAEVIAQGFSNKLQESLTAEEIAEAWNHTVEEALQPEAAGVWIKKTPTAPHSRRP